MVTSLKTTKIKKHGTESVSYYRSLNKRFGVDIDFKDRPLSFLSSLSAVDYNLVEFSMVGLPYALVNDPFLVQEIFTRRHTEFPKSQRANKILSFAFGNGILSNPSPTSHRTHRKIIMPALQRSHLLAFTQDIDRIARAHFDAVDPSRPVRVDELMFETTLSIIGQYLFSKDMHHATEFHKQMSEIFDVFNKGVYDKFNQLLPRPNWLPTPTNRLMAKAKAQATELLVQLIEERRANPSTASTYQDMLQLLMEATYEDGSPISDEQIIDELLTMVFAGHETTANTMVWALHCLSENPEVLDTLKREVDLLDADTISPETLKRFPYTDQVVKETLRLYPSVWCLAARTCAVETQIGDFTIPKGVEMLCSPYTLHRNPAYFPNPKTFDPSRFTSENEKKLPKGAFLPFGGGTRLCAGNHFAMLESKIILANFVKMFDFDRTGDPIEALPLITLSPKNGYTMHLSLRASVKTMDVKEKSFVTS